MGGSSSTQHQISPEQQELESLATSTGALSILQKSFQKLANPHSKSIPLKSLQECFRVKIEDPISEPSPLPECFPKLLLDLGPSIVDLYFTADNGQIVWIQFLRGYIKCCGRMQTSESINKMCRLYAATTTKAGFPSKIEFKSEDTDSKISGYFTSTEVHMFLLICWIMSQSSEMQKASFGKVELEVPDTSHLLLSVVTSCSEDVKDLNVWDCSPSDLKVQLPAQKIHMWILSTIPSISNCLAQYLNARLRQCAALEDNMDPSALAISVIESPNNHLLTCGRAWAVSLTLRGTLSEEILKACIPEKVDEISHNLLYQSTVHGRGLSRFWSNVEGYNGPILILVSASSEIDDGTSTGKWVIGILTGQGFENKDVFYGSSGYLYAISPVFSAFPHHGKEKNFAYSHLHISGRYDPHPKPVGIGFGGSIGNERISIDEDFSKVTIRHHAVDKTYHSGPLIPNQGFLPLEALILDVEVWGLGGELAKKEQNAFKNREQLFTDQRRKVDLKTFGNWEDSPEKMMMDMVSDPNRVRREER